MLVLHETPLGFALFKVLDEEILVKKELSNSQAEEVKEKLRKQLKESIFTADAARRRSQQELQRELKEQLREQLPSKLQEVSWENFQEELQDRFSTEDSAREVVQLKAFSQFKNASKALKAAIKVVKNKLSKGLRKFLRANCDGETLAVSDSQLGNYINRKLKIECVHNEAVMELMRGLRSWQNELILGRNLTPMRFCLSYSLSGYKLGISPDKDDPTVIRASNSLRDIDMMVNTYALRVKEWYGWHFPEMDKIVQDSILYAKAVKLMGSRDNAAELDFSEILSNEVESELKEAAVISIGSEISEEDLMLIKQLCDQLLLLVEQRPLLCDYLKSKMNTVAPNLTALVGDVVGATLIAKAGGLLNLAKQPASRIVIFGAEKAFSRFLETKQPFHKYGLLYRAHLVGQAAPEMKVKITRSLAAKVSLAVRCDAFRDGQDNSVGLQSRAKLEAWLRKLEEEQGENKKKKKLKEEEGEKKKKKKKRRLHQTEEKEAQKNADEGEKKKKRKHADS